MKSTLFTLVCVLPLIISCGEKAKQNNAPPSSGGLNADGYVVVTKPFFNELSTTARLLADEQVELMAPISGQVLQINFKEGSRVRKGQAIVRLDDRAWRAELLGVQAELNSALSDLARKKELLAVEGSTKEAIELATAKVEKLQSQKQQLQVNIDLANVKAPFSGTLGLRDFSVGAYLKQGDIITTLASSSKLKVDFELAQAYGNTLKLGDIINVHLESDTVQAKVYAIDPLVNQNTRTIRLRAELQQPKETILPGSYAEVVLKADKLESAILIPSQAVVPSIIEQTVYVSKNGTAKRVAVTLGNRNADEIHVLTGLNAGDTILTTGLLHVKDGMKVNFLKVN